MDRLPLRAQVSVFYDPHTKDLGPFPGKDKESKTEQLQSQNPCQSSLQWARGLVTTHLSFCSLLQLGMVALWGDTNDLYHCKDGEDCRVRAFQHWIQALGWDPLYLQKFIRLELVGKLRYGLGCALPDCLMGSPLGLLQGLQGLEDGMVHKFCFRNISELREEREGFPGIISNYVFDNLI